MHIFIFYFIYLKGEKGEEEGGWRGFMPSCIAIEGGGMKLMHKYATAMCLL